MLINLEKENPLKTIIKNGKIPVVRVANDGFKNYDQQAYFQNKEEYSGELPVGCFVHVGGIQARYVSGGHPDENLNIGFVDPETSIFCTYRASRNNIKEFAYNKAKNKFNDVIEGYNIDFKDEKGLITSGELEDFDLVSEAIVRAEDVTLVAVIEPKDFIQFVNFIKDDYLRLLCADMLMYYAEDTKMLPQSYLEHMGENDFYAQYEAYNNDSCCAYDINGRQRFKYFNDFFELSKSFEDIAITEFVNSCLSRNFSYRKEDIAALKKALQEFNEFKAQKHDWHDKAIINCKIFNNSSYLSVTFDFSQWRNKNGRDHICFTVFDDEFKVTETFNNPDYFYGMFSDKPVNQYIFKNVEISDLFNNEYRYVMYDFLMIYNKYKKMFSKFFKIRPIDNEDFFKSAQNAEEYLVASNVRYKVDTKEKVFTIFAFDFTVEYNLILKDAIITIPNSEKIYYNPDTVPVNFDTTEMNEYLELMDTIKI